MRTPVASLIALIKAGAAQRKPGSPVPLGGFVLSIMCTSTVGASLIRSISYVVEVGLNYAAPINVEVALEYCRQSVDDNPFHLLLDGLRVDHCAAVHGTSFETANR